MRLLLGFFSAALIGVVASVAPADSIAFTGSNGSGLAAEVDFNLDTSAHTLTITLKNTATQAASGNGNFLTGVFWNVSPAIGGSLTSVALGSGSVIVPASDTAGDAGLFGYGSSLDAHGDSYGVSSAGLGLTYDTLLTIGGVTNTSGQPSPDGPPGSLIPIANGTDSGTNSNQEPEIENSLVYTISNVSSSFATVTDISNSNVIFQYGTGLTDTTILGTAVTTPAPIPATAEGGILLLTALGIGGTLLRRLRTA